MATFVENIKAYDANLPENIDSLEFAKRMDELDELRNFRDEFHFPPPPAGVEETIYLCGNSLGLQPKSLRGKVLEHLDKWAAEGVEGHFTGTNNWVDIDKPLKKTMAKLVGAIESEVVIMNTLSCNLHLMMVPFYNPNPQKFKILIEKKAFPSDYHVVITQLQFHGYKVEDALIEVGPREGEDHLRDEDILDIIRKEGDSIALILFSGIQYYTGQFFDLETIAKVGKEYGCTIGYDLAHAAGNVPVKLHDWDVDFACWCTYKYMNSGPGSLAGCFIHEKHGQVRYSEDTNDSYYKQAVPLRLGGWWGHRGSDRFVMAPNFIPADGADGFRLSNPPVVAVACVHASLDVFERAGLDRLREKSLRLTAYLEYLIRTNVSNNVKILTPTDPTRRGAQLSLSFFKLPDTGLDGMLEMLNEEGIICDARRPDVIRIAPAPLYNNFTDVYRFVTILKKILA